jgi:hypothetical protein
MPAMACIPEVGDILAAVISIACQGGEQLSVPRIYSAIRELQGRNALLSGLYFSITGAVCYSRQVEESLRSLMAKGMLVRKEQGTLVVRDAAAEEMRAHLRRTLPGPVYRALKTASRKFYWAMFPRSR